MNYKNEKVICFLSSMHTYDDKRVFEKEAKSLADNGFKVIHVAPGDGTDFIYKNIEIRTFKNEGSTIFKRLIGLKHLYKFAKSTNADVYHCNEIDSWIIGLLLKLNHKSKCIFDVHEHYPEEFAEVRFHKSFHFLVIAVIHLLIWTLSFYTDRIVIAKSSLKKSFKHLRDNKVVLVQNFSPIKSFDNASKDDNIHFLDKKFKIIHMGLFGIARGWPELLNAMVISKNRNIELTVLGSVNDGSEDDFLSFIEKNNLSNQVNYIKWLPIEEALEIVKKCHLGLVTFQPGYHNHVHALPHKLFDYMGSGIPVIVPDFAEEVCEIIKESQSGVMIDVSDPKEIAKAINMFAGDRKLTNQMGQNGRKAVYKKFNWENEELSLVEMYSQII